MSEIPTTPVAEVPATPESTEAKTIGETLNPNPAPVVEKQPNTVPESAFLNEKKSRKDAERRVKELEDLIRDGGTRKEVSASVKSIAEKYEIDPTFLEEYGQSIYNEIESKLRAEVDSKFKPLEEKERQKEIDNKFDVHYTKAINSMPEFKEVVNPSVIKALSLLPQNANKTFSQLIEETYGSAITGKRTLPVTTPGGGKEPAPLDYARANSDKAYFKEVMADPKLKAEYNYRMLREN